MALVLVIEDDAVQRMIATLALQKAGYETAEAPDGPIGLEAARVRKPDVVVCDVMMPGMNGYEVVAAMREDPELAGVPVVLLTAMSDRKHMRQGMSAGADDYLTKPYRPDELCESVAAMLARQRAQQQAALTNLSGVVEEALQDQKEHLGRRYELQLAEEVNKRWAQRSDAASDLHFPAAIVLVADTLGPAGRSPDRLAERVKRSLQQARDSLYMFGADHVLPIGTDPLAVFDGPGSLTTPVPLRAGRAAFALTKLEAGNSPVAVGLHVGAVTLVALHDALHGDSGHSLVPGEAVDRACALRDAARREGWRVAVSPELAAQLKEQFEFGARTSTAAGHAAIELKGPR